MIRSSSVTAQKNLCLSQVALVRAERDRLVIPSWVSLNQLIAVSVDFKSDAVLPWSIRFREGFPSLFSRNLRILLNQFQCESPNCFFALFLTTTFAAAVDCTFPRYAREDVFSDVVGFYRQRVMSEGRFPQD